MLRTVRFVLIVLSRRCSLEGRGGAGDLGTPADIGSLLATASLLKNDSRRALSSLPSALDGRPIRIRASRLDSWLGFSRRRAFWVASRAVGDGGRGAGFIACATIRGMVGMLHDEMTGSKITVSFMEQYLQLINALV